MNMNMEKQARKPRSRTPVKIIVQHEFVGEKSLSDAFVPVIVEDLRRKLEPARTLDTLPESA